MNHNRKRERGTTAVEFALSALFFFTFVIGLLELSRAMFLWNTAAEVTRRYAQALASADFNDSAAQAAALRYATFNSGDGSFPMSGNINGAHFQLRYLRDDAATEVSPMPDCPAQNIINCASDPAGPGCIRFVQVRLCQPGGNGSCSYVPYVPMTPLGGVLGNSIFLPTFATLVPARSLGHVPGASGSCS
jgi:hypothetical protein